MLIDLSHASDQTFWDVLSMVHVPVIASHSSARALRNHPRNLIDAMLKVIAKNGGVVGVNFFLDFWSISDAPMSKTSLTILST